jgi:hypothetical protein
MKRDGFEADKTILLLILKVLNESYCQLGWLVQSFKWSTDGKKVYFVAAVDGTKQLFEVNSWLDCIAIRVNQITNGDFDVKYYSFPGSKLILNKR